MRLDGSTTEGATLQSHLQTIRRRKWIVLQAVILVPLIAVLFQMREPAAYQATSQVLISHRDLSSSLTGFGFQAYQDPVRIAQTQAELARVPAVAEMVVRNTGASITPEGFLGMSAATPEIDADLIDLTVTDSTPARAVTLATAYANALSSYRAQLDTAAIDEAIRGVDDQIRQLGGDATDSALAENLISKRQQLQELRALQSKTLSVVRPATGAHQVAPRPFRYGLFGLLIGAVLGLVLAFLRDTLDTRVRSSDQVGAELGATMLARVPAPPKRLAAADKLVMIEDPSGVEAEAFRMLRTNLEFVAVDTRVRSLLVTSALEGEGKSTTAANLAVARSRAGKHLALSDHDLRRPYVDRFFDLRGRPGVTQVALGRTTLDEALVPITLGGPALHVADDHAPDTPVSGNGGRHVAGLLEVLPSGPVPPDSGEFVGTQAGGRVLKELEERAEIVIIDAPPMLHVGDASALSSRVSGVLVVARLKVLRRPALRELHRVLEASPTPVLGFVATGAETESGYGARYGYAYAAPPRHEQRMPDRVAR